MNCLYITLFFNTVAGIVQTFTKSRNQLLYPRVIKVCRQPCEPRRDFFLHLIIVIELFSSLLGFRSVVKTPCFISSHNGVQKLISFLCVHLLRWEIIWRNAPRIWRDFGSALPFQTRLTQTKPILLLSNENGSQVKDQGRRQCCHNKHKNFLIGLHVMYLYFPDTPRTPMSLKCHLPTCTSYECKTCPGQPWRHTREWRYSSVHSWPRKQMEVCVQLHAPAALPPGKGTPIRIE